MPPCVRRDRSTAQPAFVSFAVPSVIILITTVVCALGDRDRGFGGRTPRDVRRFSWHPGDDEAHIHHRWRRHRMEADSQVPPERVHAGWLNSADHERFWCERSGALSPTRCQLHLIDGTVTECIVEENLMLGG